MLVMFLPSIIDKAQNAPWTIGKLFGIAQLWQQKTVP